jgi:hypothetical protein
MNTMTSKSRATDRKYRNVINRALKSIQWLNKRHNQQFLSQEAKVAFKNRLGF